MSKPRHAVTVWRQGVGTMWVTWPKIVRGAVALGDESVAWHWGSRELALAWVKATLGQPAEAQVVPYTFKRVMQQPQTPPLPPVSP